MPHLINNTYGISYMKQAQELPANSNSMYKYIRTCEKVYTHISIYIYMVVHMYKSMSACGGCMCAVHYILQY